MTTAASVLPLGGDAVLEQMRQGGEFSLHSLTADRSGVQTRRIFLFLRDTAPQYGKAGCLYWTVVPSPSVPIAAFAATAESRAELSSQCLPLHTLTDLRSAKQTEVFKSASLSRLPESLCFTLSANSGVELNLTAVSVEAKERWWNGVMIKLKEGKKQLKITNTQPAAAAAAGSAASPTPPVGASAPAPPLSLSIPNGLPSSSPPASSPTASMSPASLKRLLNTGAFFRKYDLDPGSQAVTVSSIFLWAEGVGKQGDLYWVEATPSANFQPPPSHVLPASHSLPLSRITDFMLRKKSPALKASPAADSCCFALVSSDRFTLNLECESREVCKNWREGLINMLLTAGKQVVRADAATTPTSSNGQQQHSASGSASPTAALAPSSAALPRSQSEEREVFLLTTGAVFTLYYTNSRHQPEQAKITLFFVELLPPSEPGALCWCSVGSKRMIEGQRLMLNSMKQMISGCEHASFRHSLPAEGAQQLDPDCCFTIVGKSLILNLEAGSQSVREGWMKGLHGVMLRYQQAVQEKKRQQQEMASRAAREIIASNDASFAQAAAQSAAAQNVPPSPTSPAMPLSRSPSPSLSQGAVQQASHSPSPSFSFPNPGLEDQIARLRKGDQFTLYTAASSSPSDIQSHAIFLFFVDDPAGPGYLYYCAPPPAPRQLLDNQRFSLASLSKMVGGKETAIFQNERMRAVPVDRCLSIIGKHSMLNVEAKGVELRDLWIKTLHAIMTRYKSSRQQTGAAAAAAGLTPPAAGAAVSVNGLHPAVLSSPGSSSPLVGSAPPSPSSANQPPVMAANPLYNPAVPTSPPPASGLISPPPTVPHLLPPASPTTSAPQLSPASFASEPEAVFLSTPHPFKLYSSSPVGFPLIIDVCLFFHPISPPSADSPGALFWSSPGRKEMKDSQKLPLNRILQMAGGKDTLIFRHPAAASVAKERCLYVTSATVSLSLEAPSVEAKNVWMQQLHALILKMGRQTVEERKTPTAAAPALPRPPMGSSLTAPMNGGAPSPHHSPSSNSANAARPPSPLTPAVPAPLTPPPAGAPAVPSPSAAASSAALLLLTAAPPQRCPSPQWTSRRRCRRCRPVSSSRCTPSPPRAKRWPSASSSSSSPARAAISPACCTGRPWTSSRLRPTPSGASC